MFEFPNPSGGTWHKPEVKPAKSKRTRVWDKEPEPIPIASDEDSPPLVLVTRTVHKWVTDAEAEVLSRFGWRIIEDAIEVEVYKGSDSRLEGDTADTEGEKETP